MSKSSSQGLDMGDVTHMYDRSSAKQQTSGGGGEGTLEARVAKLESDVGHIQRDVSEIKTDIREILKDMKTDFRLTFGALIAVALGLAAIMAHGFRWI